MSSVKGLAWRRQTLCSSALMTSCTAFASMTVPLSMMCAMPLLVAVAILLEEVTKKKKICCSHVTVLVLLHLYINLYLIFCFCCCCKLPGDFNVLENYQGGGFAGYYGGGGYYYGHGINLVVSKFLLLIVSLNFILFLL
jgi:hypothetical protein